MRPRTAAPPAPRQALSPPTTSFDKAQFLVLKRVLMTRPRTLVSVAVLASIAGFGALALWLAGGSWPAYLASQLLLAIVFFQGFGLLHDCGHNTASPTDWVNVAFGHIASVVCFLPFYPWRYIHQQHHLWAGNLQRDPVLAAIRRWTAVGKVPAVLGWGWRLWLPLLAPVQHVVFWLYPLKLASLPQRDWRQLLRCTASVLFLGAAYLALFALVGEHLPPSHFVPALLIYMLAAELVNLPHHVGAPLSTERLPPWRQWISTRTCVFPRGVAEFCMLNFNFHVEHHVFPFLPWYRLRAAQRLLRQAIGAPYQEEVGIGWSVRNRARPLDQVIISVTVSPDLPVPAPIADLVNEEAACFQPQ
jgi:omega-6 fatty acid desaturase (delta-12 desaturase)